MKIHLYYIGKPRDARTHGIAEDFIERVAHYARIDMRQIRPERAEFWSKHAAARKICLDPAGRLIDSREFTALVERSEREARDLVFVVGGAEGLPAGWRERADLALSLSPLTFPHELARALLAEQLYRAFTTLRGHPYPR
ncbi:MAG: 23S rRNA (pseudouridine(1915)-N(3))-methyltransferase RlmH [Acidobacteria bacterium]|nr:23S rRNA (pseudouridine(1915)-N(3))-methyltransferase RlmH [Acidobacteriota bacterium]MBI3470571.1 23S rRNA (pseudouridine(1915)-N(3))-methyltransferase RlmH [Candidatus Solibacter usitatus]